MNQSGAFQGLKTLAISLHEEAGYENAWPRAERAAQACFGFVFLTILGIDAKNGRMIRLYSSTRAPDRAGGVKAITKGTWTTSILQKGKILVCLGPDDLARTFSNFQAILNTGCTSSLNIPVRFSGETIGSLNLFGAAGAYDALDAGLAACFSQILVAPFLNALAHFPSYEPNMPMEPI